MFIFGTKGLRFLFVVGFHNRILLILPDSSYSYTLVKKKRIQRNR